MSSKKTAPAAVPINARTFSPDDVVLPGPIVHVPVESLIPYARNARTHSDAQVAQVAASIVEFGWTNPVLVAGRSIVAGHGRVLAARKLGLPLVPTLDLSHLTETQRRAYVLADNQLATKAGWDSELLSLELADLKADGFDLTIAGFDSVDLAGILDQTTGETDPDDVPDVPAKPVTVPGDVWLLGRHRIVCGDSTTVESVEKALAGAKPHLMVTDPPYGVEYDPSWRDGALGASNGPGRAKGEVRNDDRVDWREAWTLFPGEVAYVWHADPPSPVVGESLIACDFELRNLVVWAKDSLVIGRGHYHHQHELCWYAVKKGGTGHWNGDRKQTTLWSIPKPQKSETGHGTQKPIECMKRPIENNSKPGDHVYEPFSGSGTTIIACEQAGRVCHAIELSPVYVDVAVKRWQSFTGKAATLEGDGRTFAEVEASRA